MKRFFKIDSEGKIEEFEPKTTKKKNEENFHYFKFLNIGFYLITPLLICLLIGIYLKKVFFFIFLGTVFVFYNLIKIVKE